MIYLSMEEVERSLRNDLSGVRPLQRRIWTCIAPLAGHDASAARAKRSKKVGESFKFGPQKGRISSFAWRTPLRLRV